MPVGVVIRLPEPIHAYPELNSVLGGEKRGTGEPRASGSGWVPLSPPPYPVNAQGRANCRYRGQPRAKEDEREREKERKREREREREGQGQETDLNSEYPERIDESYG